MSLRHQTLHALFWAAFSKYSISGISFLTQLVLARLLTAEAFGVVAVISVVLTGMYIFPDLGLGKTIIARQNVTNQALNATFFLSMMMGTGLFGVMFFAAPLISVAFRADEMNALLRLASVRLLIASLGTVPTALLEKELRFKSLVWPRVAGKLVMSSTSVSMAALGLGAWSMVWGGLAESMVQTTLTWIAMPWRPATDFNLKIVKDLVSYGKHVIGISFGTFLHANLDTILVGQALGMVAVGQYNLAFTLANALPLLIMQMAAPVLLPTFSQLQDDRRRLASAHLRFVKYVLVIVTPMCVIVGLLAQEIILVLYGERWRGAIAPLIIFSLYALFRQVAASNSPILMVTNKVKEFNLIVYLHLALFILLAFPAIWAGGLIGMGVLMVVLVILSGFLALLVSSKALQNPLVHYARLAVLPVCAAIFSSLILLASSKMLNLQVLDHSPQQMVSNVAIMTIKTAIFLVCYTVTLYMLDADVHSEIRANLTSLVHLSSLKGIFRG